jgi:hypothetical protein
MEIMRMVLMTGLLVTIGVLVLTLVARAGHGPALPSARPGATTKVIAGAHSSASPSSNSASARQGKQACSSLRN